MMRGLQRWVFRVQQRDRHEWYHENTAFLTPYVSLIVTGYRISDAWTSGRSSGSQRSVRIMTPYWNREEARYSHQVTQTIALMSAMHVIVDSENMRVADAVCGSAREISVFVDTCPPAQHGRDRMHRCRTPLSNWMHFWCIFFIIDLLGMTMAMGGGRHSCLFQRRSRNVAYRE